MYIYIHIQHYSYMNFNIIHENTYIGNIISKKIQQDDFNNNEFQEKQD